MVTITFPNREPERRALGFLIGRFSGRANRTGEHFVSEAALVALAEQNIPFSVKGKTTYAELAESYRSVAEIDCRRLKRGDLL